MISISTALSIKLSIIQRSASLREDSVLVGLAVLAQLVVVACQSGRRMGRPLVVVDGTSERRCGRKLVTAGVELRRLVVVSVVRRGAEVLVRTVLRWGHQRRHVVPAPGPEVGLVGDAGMRVGRNGLLDGVADR